MMKEPVLITYGLPVELSEPARVAAPEAVSLPAVPYPPPASLALEDVEAAAQQVSLEELRRQAAQEGYREGYDAGAEAARLELAQELESLRGLGGSVREALARGIEGLEDVMVEIA